MEVLGDSAYATGDMLAALQRREWTPVLKPWPIRPAVPGGFSIDDFTHDPAAGTLTCPNGITRRVTKKRTATFGAACRGCPLAPRCTTSRRGRRIKLHEHDQLQRDHRARAADERSRPPTAPTGPWSNAPSPGSPAATDACPTAGSTKNNAWLHHRVAGINLRRMLALGLTHHDGAWQLA